MNNQDNINKLTAHLFRENSGKMVAVLSRMFGLSQIDIVMDVVQDTFEVALSKWRFSGIPDNPGGWLMQVAKNKALNTFKREIKIKAFLPSLDLNDIDRSAEHELENLLSQKAIDDSQLRLLLTCCHPDFSTKNQIIITLNILCGFGVPEIANALLMNEEAIKKALTRCKASLRKWDNILETNHVTQSEEQINTVLTILYLMFNEGYKTTRSQEAINIDLCYEAIRLAKLLVTGFSDSNSETNALLALMFFNISRFPARLGSSNEWLTLEEQDRSQWNKIFIEEGYHYLNKSTSSEIVTRFHLEAMIASLHCAAPNFEATDWKKIAYLYQQLEGINTSPVVTLSRVIAESYLNHSNSIQALDELEAHGGLKNNFLLQAAKGDIYKRQGEIKKAKYYFEQAMNLCTSPIDKKFLEKKIL